MGLATTGKGKTIVTKSFILATIPVAQYPKGEVRINRVNDIIQVSLIVEEKEKAPTV